jgi:SAM-dependent methyltransferase
MTSVDEVGETSRHYLNEVVDTPPPYSFFRYVLPLTRGRKVLDVGAGAGQFLTHFGPNGVGLDISEPNLRLCRERGLTVRRSDFNNRLQSADAEFDVVFCSHVLEHVDAPINLLRECNRCLKDDGMLILSVPTEHSIVRWVRDSYFEDHPEHLYAFSPKNLKWLLSKTGFVTDHTFMDFRKVTQWRLGWFSDVGQKFPAWSTLWMSSAYWLVAHKTGPWTLPTQEPER